MFEHLDTPTDLFTFRLGSLLSAEHDSLAMLQDLERAVDRSDLKQMFAHHAEETRQQIANVERCFTLLGQQPDDSPSPTTQGLAKEAQSLIRKSDPTLVDSVAVSGGLATEHYEIATYTTLIDMARSQGATQITELLEANLAQEREACDKLAAAGRQLAGLR